MQPLAQLIVAIDMVLDAKTPPPAAVLEALIRQSYGLLAPTETAGDLDDHGFARHYFEALQRDPEVVVAHGEVIRLRRARPAP